MLLIGSAFLFFNGQGSALADIALEGAAQAVTLTISLIGAYALWMGVMNIAQEAGFVQSISRMLRPVLTRLFPGVPPEGKVAQDISLNLSANVLGLGNAATPYGLSAMQGLQQLNGGAKVASNAMCMLLVVNSSILQLLPTTVIAMRASAGSTQPASIMLPMLLATAASMAVGILTAKCMEGRRWKR